MRYQFVTMSPEQVHEFIDTANRLFYVQSSATEILILKIFCPNVFQLYIAIYEYLSNGIHGTTSIQS